MTQKAVVVGAGLGGLAAAALLAHQGFEVTVLEKNAAAGGRARVWREGGFVFDMGPSWYLMPEVFEDFFALLGRRREDYYQLKPLDPCYRIFFSKDDAVDLTPDQEASVRLFERLETGGGAQLRRYLDLARHKYEVAMKEFLSVEYRSVFQFLNKRMITQGLRLNVFSSLDGFVSRFFKDRRTRQILEYATVFLGASPSNAPALYSILSHIDLNLGVWYPDGGFGSVVAGLVKLCGELGVKIEYSTEVDGYDFAGQKIRTVKAGDRRWAADAVVVNADYHHAETKLLPPKRSRLKPAFWEKRVVAPCLFVIYLGLARKVSGLVHHNLYFTENWDEHFAAIFKRPSWPENPCFYVSCPSTTDPSVAPSGKENLFLLVPVAAGLDDSLREAYADRLIAHVERVTGSSIVPNIEVKRIFSHRDYAGDYNAYKGSALGLAHVLSQTAVFRPSLRSKSTRNLFYCGQYTHPGVGVPMVLIAARLAAQAVCSADLHPRLAAIFRRGSRTYFHSSLFFPPVLRRDVSVLYAFVRTADDFVDATPQNGLGFRAFRESYERAWHTGTPSGDLIIDAFIELALRCRFQPEWITAFLDSMEADLFKTRYDNLEETLRYMYGSAEVIGLCMAALLSLPPEAHPAARALGRSMQYINFIRDVEEDHGLGRTYLPLEGSGLKDLSQVSAEADPAAFIAFMRAQAVLYLKWQAEAEAGFAFIPWRSRIPILTASRMYRWTARTIWRDPFVVYRRKVKPSRVRILVSVGLSALRVFLGRR